MHEPDTTVSPEEALRGSDAPVGDIDSTEIRNARIIGVVAGLTILAVLCILAALAIASRGGV